MEDVERIEIPTPFSVGPVNCYVFDGNGLALIDPGPATEDAYAELEDSLAHRGHAVEEVDRVLITHPHMDHFGLGRRIVERSDARVFAHEDAADRLADPVGQLDREQAFFRPFLRSMGMPSDAVDTVLRLPEPYTEFNEPVSVTDPLEDGDVLDLGVRVDCVSTPGHSPGSLCFSVASEAVMFTGDHVLPTITPNPLLTLRPDSDTERTRSLPTYLASLRKVLDADATVGFGGHGEPMSDLPARIEETIDHHEERKERIAALLAAENPKTPYQLMKELFPELPATEMFSGMSEVIGHLDLLEDEGRLELTEIDNQQHYEITSG